LFVVQPYEAAYAAGGMVSSMGVTRLPTQHRQHPHCPACKTDLPTFDTLSLATPLGEFRLLGITFHVRCKCGLAYDMRKDAKT
jgi:hypothetical protein